MDRESVYTFSSGQYNGRGVYLYPCSGLYGSFGVLYVHLLSGPYSGKGIDIYFGQAHTGA